MITAFNAATTIGRALTSIQRQTVVPEQVIVVDDGSTDRTAEIASSFRDRLPLDVVSVGRRGRAVSLNIAASRASTELIAVLDADDASMPDRTELQEAFLTSHPNVGMVGGAFLQVTYEPGVTARLRSMPLEDRAIRHALAYSGPFCHSSVAYRRRALAEAGGFDMRRRTRIDQDLWVRIAASGWQLANLQEPLALHVKDRATYFARRNTLTTRVGVTLTRSFSAVRSLELASWWYCIALGRALASVLPQGLMAQFAPGLRAKRRALGGQAAPPAELLALFDRPGPQRGQPSRSVGPLPGRSGTRRRTVHNTGSPTRAAVQAGGEGKGG